MSHQQIIDDIRSQMEKELDEIRLQSDSVQAQRKEILERKIADIVAEADEKIAQEKNRTQSRTSRILTQEERRAILALQERVLQNVIERVRGELDRFQKDPDYTRTLRSWLIEAAIGLGCGPDSNGASPKPAKALIRCSPEDRKFFEQNLQGFQEEITVLTGMAFELGMDSHNLAAGTTGLVLIDEGGRMAFSNTLTERFRRVYPDIHKLVMERFFPGEVNE